MRLPVDGFFHQLMKAPVMRSVNGIALLDLIRKSGPISRAGLSKLSRLSKPTVSEQVNWLIRQGVVIELGQGEVGRTGGKRPTLVDFNVDAGRVVGVNIGASRTTVASADLRGRIVASQTFDTAPEEGAGPVLQRIYRAITGLKRKDALVADKLRVIAVGVPGRVDCDRGVVLESSNIFGWRKVDVRSYFQDKLGVDVLVDNDANVALLGELNHGDAREASNAVLIKLDTGIGSAMAIERRIYHGSHWASGEIGHVAPDPQAALEHPDPRGHLESVVGADQIAKRVGIAARRSRTIRSLLKANTPIAALFLAAADADPEAVPIARELESRLKVVVAQQALAFDPDVVVLSGEIFTHTLEAIRSFLSKTIPWPVTISLSRLGDDAILLGAIVMALEAVYEQMSRQLQPEAAAQPVRVGA